MSNDSPWDAEGFRLKKHPSYCESEIYIRDGLIASRTGRNKGDFTQKLFRL